MLLIKSLRSFDTLKSPIITLIIISIIIILKLILYNKARPWGKYIYIYIYRAYKRLKVKVRVEIRLKAISFIKLLAKGLNL